MDNSLTLEIKALIDELSNLTTESKVAVTIEHEDVVTVIESSFLMNADLVHRHTHNIYQDYCYFEIEVKENIFLIIKSKS